MGPTYNGTDKAISYLGYSLSGFHIDSSKVALSGIAGTPTTIVNFHQIPGLEKISLATPFPYSENTFQKKENYPNATKASALCTSIFYKAVTKEMFPQFSKLTMVSKAFNKNLFIAMKANTLFTERFVKSFEYFLQDTRYAIHPSGFLKEIIENIPSLSVSVIKDTNLSNVAKIIQLAQSLKSISFHMLTFTTEMLQALSSSIETLKFNSIDFEDVKVSNEKFKSFQRLKEVEFGACSDEKDIIQGFSTVSSIEKISIRDLGIASLDFLTQLQALRSLNIESCEQITPASLTVLSKLSNLKSLKIDTCEKITDLQALAHLKINQLTLRHLDLNSDQSKYIASLTNLESLKLEHYNNRMQIPLQEFLSKLDKLQELTLENSRIKDEDIKEIARRTTLTKISFYRSKTLVDDYTPLVQLPNLQELDIRGIKTELLLKDNVITRIKSLKKLHLDKGVFERLPKGVKDTLKDFVRKQASTDIDIKRFEKLFNRFLFPRRANASKFLKAHHHITDQKLFKALQKLPYLEILDISYTDVNCEKLEMLPHKLLSLKSINLASCREITDRGFLALLQKCPNIEKLNVRETNISDKVLEQLPDQLLKLKSINLAYCGKITDQGFLALLQKCPNIENLNVEETSINGEVLEGQLPHKLLSLKSIYLAYCGKITDQGLLALLQSCPNIENLSATGTNISGESLGKLSHKLLKLNSIKLTDCRIITDQGLLALLQKCPNIEELNVTGTSISGESLGKLTHQLLKLKSINLSNCKEITNRGFLALLQKCPNIEKLNIAVTNISDEGLEKLPDQLLKLKSINLAYCNKVTSQGRQSLSKKYPTFY